MRDLHSKLAPSSDTHRSLQIHAEKTDVHIEQQLAAIVETEISEQQRPTLKNVSIDNQFDVISAPVYSYQYKTIAGE